MKLLVLTQTVNSDDPVLGFFCGWLRALAQRMQWVDVVALEQRTNSLPANVQVHSAGRERGQSRHITWLRFARQMHRQLRDDPPDVILAHMCPEYVLAAAPFARRRRIPLILWYAHCSASLALRLAQPLVRCVMTPVPGGFPLAGNTVYVTGHGIDVQIFRPAEELVPAVAPPRILSVGRLAPVKRHDVMFEAARLLARRGRPFQWQIIGDAARGRHDEYRRRLEIFIQRAGLKDRVSFVGNLPPSQLASRYQQCVCVVNASPNPDKVVFEAMACGKVPVVSNPAFRDVLGADAECHLFNAGDAEALADRLEEWLAVDAAERTAVGQRLRQRIVQHHSLDHLAQRLMDIAGTCA